MEQSIHLWFQSRPHHLLRDSVRNSWYAQFSFPTVRFRSLVCFPDLPFGNTKRLCLTHRAPPIAGWLIESGSLTQRLRSIPLSGTSLLLHVVPPLRLRIRTLALMVASTCSFSVCIEVSDSHVPLNRLFGKLRPPLMPDAAPPVSRFRRS